MKSLPVLSILLLAFVSPSVIRANPDAGFPKSPEVSDDGRVTFRFIAPEAKKVEVRGKAVGGKAELKKAGNGWWEFTSADPVEPGIYDYHFVVDGVYTLDPHNRWFKGWRRSANQFVVPGDPPRLWEEQAVPHGEIHRHLYPVEPLKTEREAFVYTPPGYHESGRTYPVLVLMHGSGDDPSAWTNVGRAHLIADNLIAQGKIEPLVIVMPHGHAKMPGVDLESIADRGEWYRHNNAAVEADLFETLIPRMEKRYRIRKDAAGRAIAGLSMGGGQALAFGLNRPDQFDWVAGFSSGVPGNAEAAQAQYEKPGKSSDAFQLVWIACGRDDFLLERNEFFRKWLTERGVDHTWKLTDGGHSWPVWRDYLAEVLPLLFRD